MEQHNEIAWNCRQIVTLSIGNSIEKYVFHCRTLIPLLQNGNIWSMHKMSSDNTHKTNRLETLFNGWGHKRLLFIRVMGSILLNFQFDKLSYKWRKPESIITKVLHSMALWFVFRFSSQKSNNNSRLLYSYSLRTICSD